MLTPHRLLAALSLLLVIAVAVGCNRQSVAEPPLIGEARLSMAGLADGPPPPTFGPGPATLAADPPSDPGAQLRIAGGRLTNDPSGPGRAAGYYTSADLGGPITRIGARWTFAPRGGSQGAMALVVSRNGLNLPFSVHLNITPKFWSFGVWPAGGGPGTGLQTLGYEQFDVPLAQDGTTEHETQVVIEGERVDVTLPDGEHRVIRDPRIAEWAGSFATFEVYADNAMTDSRAGFTDVWAESRDVG
ncbi:hypothetical protein GCM10023114_18460 [Mycolicibacterium sediminis]|uniref:Uncharacterized protein n=1 Tax=Mycolicibacterium sediminis TaxID=1286180 RepID=A0A7I7QQR6_9MYCO|nr:hypothetical protein MSEDJ_27210 [Mycolicibacterium sediminis]